MEQVINDSLGNTITLVYDQITDSVTVNNSGIDTDYHEVTKNVAVVDDVIQIDGTEGENTWENWSDEETRGQVRLFWDTHKVNKD
jgi:hypothetical protein